MTVFELKLFERGSRDTSQFGFFLLFKSNSQI